MLQATALVHEAYLRLVGPDQAQRWDNAGHFFAAASLAMRRILVENARRKKRARHGGHLQQVEYDLTRIQVRMAPDELIALDDALEELARLDPRKARLVTLRYFGGMTIEQAAEVLHISRATAHRDWTYARAWLYRQINGGDKPG